MSEQLTPQNHESLPKAESKESREKLDRIGEKLSENAEKSRKNERSGERLQARETAEKLAISGKEKAPSGSENKKDTQPVHRNVKKQTYNATMRRVEAKLPSYQQTFSKVINNPTVDKVSNIAGRTVARPSGILGGGVFAFLGLVFVGYYASSYGFELMGSEFIILLAIGWVAGLLVEAGLKLVRR